VDQLDGHAAPDDVDRTVDAAYIAEMAEWAWWVRHNLPIVIVVSNNEGWTVRVEGIRKPGRELGFTRFDKVAEALGGYGELVEDPNDIRPALERAFDAGVPAIVNVRTDPTARALSRFVGSKME
jgi:acetolactate synthase-1/2/3 large subunit